MRRTHPAIAPVLAALLLGATAAPASPEDAAEFHEKAVIRFAAAEYEAAVIELKNALQAHPEHRPSQILMARAYLEMGAPGAAEEHLLNARELGADEALIVLPLAESYLAQRKYKDLILNLRYSGYAPEVEYRLRTFQGRAHVQLGELDRAARAYQDAQRLDPMAPEPLAGEAMVLMLQGSVELGRSKADVAIRRAPDSVEAWYAKGAIEHAVGETDAALGAYDKVLELDPSHLDARLARATLHVNADRLPAAEEDLKELRVLYPFDARITYMQSVLVGKQGDAARSQSLLNETAQLLNAMPQEVLNSEDGLQLLGGIANFGLKAYEQSEQYLKRYLARKPEDPGARRVLGSLYMQRGSYIEALDTLEPVLERAPNDPRVLSMMATAYNKRQRHADALPLLERAVLTSGGDVRLRTDLALTRHALGDQPAAINGLESVIGEAPDNLPAGVALAGMYIQRQDYERAAAVTEALLEHHAGHTAVMNQLATARFRLGQRAEAAALLERIVARQPGYLPARINLAKIDVAEGRLDAARQRYAKILEEHPEHVPTLIEQARLAERQGRLLDAVAWVEKARAVQPRSVPATVYLIDLYLDAGETAKALKVSAGAEEWAPEDVQLGYAMARAYLADGQAARAATGLQRLATAASYDARTLVRIAVLQEQAEALDDAAWSLRKAIDGDPGLLSARVKLVAVLIRLERAERALEVAQALRQAAPDSPLGFGAEGEALAALGRMDEALEAFRRALEASGGEFAAVKYFQAQSVVTPDAADDWLQGWVTAHPDHLLARQALAEVHLRRGRRDQARAEYETLLTARPRDPQLLNNYALLLHAAADPRAMLAAERAHKLAPNDPDVNDTLGWLLVESGEVQRGLSYLRNAHSRAGRNPEIRYHIGVALHRLERHAEARKELQAALDADRPFNGREAALRLLARLSE